MVPHQCILRIRFPLSFQPCNFKKIHSICFLSNCEALAAFFHPHLRHRLDLADIQFDQQHLPNSFKFTAVCHQTSLRLTVHHIQKLPVDIMLLGAASVELRFEKTRLHQSYARDDFEISSFHHTCSLLPDRLLLLQVDNITDDSAPFCQFRHRHLSLHAETCTN